MNSKSRTTQALECLLKVIAGHKAEGSYFLPPERQLCEEFGLSRVTLRRALAILEERGVLIAGRNGRQITELDSGKESPTIYFCAFGCNRIHLSARFRLWNNLRKMAKEHGFQPRLVLYDESHPLSPEQFRNPHDFVVVSDNINGSLDLFLKEREKQANIIGTDSMQESALKYIVTLDDYAVGALAARQLLEAGYKTPGFLGLDNGSASFRKRAAGFRETLLAAGVEPACEKWLYAKTLADKIKDLVLDADSFIQPGQDSLFVFSDEMIVVIHSLIAQRYRIPGQFGLITVNGSGNSVSHYPPITAISHASGRTAAAILDLIEELRQGRSKEGGIIKIQPSVHEGTSIGTNRVIS